MATYKVTNADAPIESDYWIDYPIKDPATNLDSIDEEGHILVERHVTRSVNLASYNSVLAKMPAVDANTTGLANLKTYAETNVQALNTALDGANTSITSVTKTATDTATTVSNIQKKLDTIKGIDIDEFKLVTETNIRTNDANAVHITGNEIISGVKIFNNTTKMNNVNVSGDIYKETTNSCLYFRNGAGTTGAYALLYGSDHATYPGHFDITARADSETFAKLIGRPDGSLTWNSKNIVCTINDIEADVNGNVVLGSVVTGALLPFAGKYIPNGYLLCNGATVSRTTYANLFTAIGTLYGAGNGSTTFNLPDLRDRFIEGAGTNALAKYIEAGLPNIFGTYPIYPDARFVSGAFYRKSQTGYGSTRGSGSGGFTTGGFEASRSNSIYGESPTVQPKSLCLNYIIKI